MDRDTKYGAPAIENEDREETDKQSRRCIVDEEVLCPPSRYDCARPCPYVGWEKRLRGEAG